MKCNAEIQCRNLYGSLTLKFLFPLFLGENVTRIYPIEGLQGVGGGGGGVRSLELHPFSSSRKRDQRHGFEFSHSSKNQSSSAEVRQGQSSPVGV